MDCEAISKSRWLVHFASKRGKAFRTVLIDLEERKFFELGHRRFSKYLKMSIDKNGNLAIIQGQEYLLFDLGES